MISAFCIRRPRFAFVISILITLAGLLSMPLLPVAQFPDITPATISVTTSYSGASADVMRDSVAVPIETQVNGVEGMAYMSSTSGNDGSYSLTVTFESGIDDDMAQVNVQNRVQQATPSLPEDVKRNGVTVQKQSNTLLLVVNLFSPNETFDELFLNNYGEVYLKDELARVAGVSSVTIFGTSTYAMRIWLNPDRMASLDVTTSDVINAVQAQNIQVAAGQLGSPPIRQEQQFQYNIIAQGRLVSAEEFADITIRAKPDGGMVKIKDVARVELGSESYASYGQLDNKPAAVIGIYQLPDANAIEVADGIKAKVAELSQRFPEDLKAEILYDTTLFVEASMKEVTETLIIALILVIVVVFIFLQDWRSTLIPAIAIPVSLIGTFALMLALGMTINTITLFALILAIGIVVDDAIVVVENTQRLMGEGLAPREAALESMREVTGPVIATTLVLLAVFVPVMLMPGLTGKMYQQFAITISMAVIISSINALTLSPALCASVLKAERGGETAGARETGVFGFFNRILHRATNFYMRMVRFWVGIPLLGIASIVGLLLLCYWLFTHVPTGFIPDEDQGTFMLHVQLPDGASLERTGPVVDKVTDILMEEKGMAHVVGVPGYNMLSSSAVSNAAMMFAILKPWEERTAKEDHQFAIMERVQERFAEIPGAQVMTFAIPPLPGIGTVGGFEFVLEDLQGRSASELAQVMYGLLGEANQSPEIAQAFTSFQATTPQLQLILNKDKAHVLGVPLPEVYSTLQTLLGGYYINDFNLYGKVFKVMVQADAQFRDKEEDLAGFYVRANSGGLVPVTSVADIAPMVAPQNITRYNLYNSVTINGAPAPGRSSGEAMKTMEALAAQLPEGYGYEWTGASLQEISSGNMAPILFTLAIVFVYLFLVAQYESWSIPLAVILCVPIAIAGAMFAVWVTDSINNLYTQIGLVLLIGMAAKSAILITEFASVEREKGKPIVEAAVSATKLRFRAVLMTALSFILGVVPLLLATGAGAVSRVSLGLAVFGGMTAASIFATLLVPVYYALVQGLREKIKGVQTPKE
ncbi:multidrug efflux RND transporter permease subunit [Microbulbifer thermotolerans]|uniref:efflux RND transporter permease subunit n=1 Tax=Microbulbifer thermotolerans TaxID=252514 RepID=UPI0026727ACA|nr:multidrug efflux RND transporter permease subunit [Microbulbifer thermotolerans]WKT59484.1 multidrug efflux RND transporter permease subunit [Microbulbifer thermotolerans]